MVQNMGLISVLVSFLKHFVALLPVLSLPFLLLCRFQLFELCLQMLKESNVQYQPSLMPMITPRQDPYSKGKTYSFVFELVKRLHCWTDAATSNPCDSNYLEFSPVLWPCCQRPGCSPYFPMVTAKKTLARTLSMCDSMPSLFLFRACA